MMMVQVSHTHKKSQYAKGVALITTMLIAAIAAIIAAKATTSYDSTVRRTTNIIGSDQGLLYIYSIEDWVKHILAKDARKSVADFPGEDWTIHIPLLPIEGGSASGKITDETAKYNINNLLDDKGMVDKVAFERLQRLVIDLELPGSLAEAIADWIDSDTNPRRAGAEDSFYLSRNPPYRSANQAFTDISELRLVAGVTPSNYRKLTQHLTALPLRTSINANFANASVLGMLDESLNADIVSAIRKRQNKKDAFKSHAELLQQINSLSDDAKLSSRLPATDINTSTQFFRLELSVNYNGAQTSAVSIIQRKSATQIRVIYRILGAWSNG